MSTIIFFEIFNSYLQTASKNFIKFKRHVHIYCIHHITMYVFLFFSPSYIIFILIMYIYTYTYIYVQYIKCYQSFYILRIYMIYYMNTSYQNQFLSSHIYIYITVHIHVPFTTHIYIYIHDSLTFTNHHPLPFFKTSFLL